MIRIKLTILSTLHILCWLQRHDRRGDSVSVGEMMQQWEQQCQMLKSVATLAGDRRKDLSKLRE